LENVSRVPHQDFSTYRIFSNINLFIRKVGKLCIKEETWFEEN